MPAAIVLSCRPDSIPVLQAGAALIHDVRTGNDSVRPSHWEPGKAERVASLRCDLASGDDVDAGSSLFPHYGWPLEFVAPRASGAPGVEWAHEDGDMAVLNGAYRWMPSPE